jgi:RNA polymerase sigma-70 factor (ECF subfamily)
VTDARTTMAGRPMGESLSSRGRANTDARSRAFAELADQHLMGAYKLANAILANPADAQDAVHDSFEKAWGRWEGLRDISKFESWFKRIVVNTCRDRLRQASRRRASDISDLRIATPDSTGQVHERERVERALARLAPDDRILLALRYYRDLKIDDIAELLDIPSGTATSRLRTAHTRLRSVLEQVETAGSPS